MPTVEPITLDELGLRLGHRLDLTGIGGGGGAGIQEFALQSQADPGNGTLTVTVAPTLSGNSALLIIDPGSVNCELRAAKSINGAVVTLDRTLVNTHSASAKVLYWPTPLVPTHMFGCKGDTAANDEPGLQAGVNETRLAGVYLEGFNKTHLISSPLFAATGADLRHMKIQAKAGYAPADWNNAMLVSGQDAPIAFTALASNDTFTTPSAHGIGGVGALVAFKGSSLPSPLVAGRMYYAKTVPNSTSLTVAQGTTVVGVNALNSGTINVADTTGFPTSGTAVINGSNVTYTGKTSATLTGCGSHAAYVGNEFVLGPTFDLTSDGSGTLYPELLGLERMYLDDVFVDGQNIAGVSGIFNACQQPQMWRKVRADNCLRTGVKIAGQDGTFINLQCGADGTGLQIGGNPGDPNSPASEMKFYALDIENSVTEAIKFVNAQDMLIDGFHGETNPIHFHLPVAGAIGDATFIQCHVSLTGGADTIWKIEAGGPNNSAYQIIGLHVVGGAGTDKVIDDLDRGRTLLKSGLPDQVTFTLGMLVQKGGNVAWTILDALSTVFSVRTSAPGLGSIPANSTTTFASTLTGATAGMAVSASPEGNIGTGLVWSAYVNAADSVTIIVANITTGALTPTDRNWQVRAQ